MFIWSAHSILSSFKLLLPEMYEVFAEGDPFFNTKDEVDFMYMYVQLILDGVI